MRAIEARLAEARRKQDEWKAPAPAARGTSPRSSGIVSPVGADKSRDAQIEAELEALRRELKRG